MLMSTHGKLLFWAKISTAMELDLQGTSLATINTELVTRPVCCGFEAVELE